MLSKKCFHAFERGCEARESCELWVSVCGFAVCCYQSGFKRQALDSASTTDSIQINDILRTYLKFELKHNCCIPIFSSVVASGEDREKS